MLFYANLKIVPKSINNSIFQQNQSRAFQICNYFSILMFLSKVMVPQLSLSHTCLCETLVKSEMYLEIHMYLVIHLEGLGIFGIQVLDNPQDFFVWGFSPLSNLLVRFKSSQIQIYYINVMNSNTLQLMNQWRKKEYQLKVDFFASRLFR